MDLHDAQKPVGVEPDAHPPDVRLADGTERLVAEERVRTVGEMLRVVMPALREILTPDELAATSTRVIRQPSGHPVPDLDLWPALAADDLLADDVLLELRIFDHRRGSWTQGGETAVAMCARFRSELQDYVAESTFGWGQYRP